MTKAKTKAAKRRSKGGRPRIKDAERYPSGQIKHDWRADDIKATVIEMRQRVHGISQEATESPLAGYLLGRMYLDRSITEVEREAGDRYAEDMASYYGLTGIPHPSPRAQSLFSVAGHDGEVSSDRAMRARDQSNRIMRLEGELLKCFEGPRVKTTVFNVCVLDLDHLRDMPPSMFGYLRRGLRALALHYGLQDAGKSAITK